MKIRTPFLLFAALILVILTSISCSKSKMDIMAVTGATPGWYDVDTPRSYSLTVDGMVKRTYVFNATALNAFPSAWRRTMERSASGEFQGTYAYTGIPLIAIMDGIAPQKPKTAAFDRPLDMLVTFTSADGRKAHFSYGELTMVDDSLPVMLAFDRRQVLPTDDKTKASYTHNLHKENLTGLRLICPADPDTARYLDNVVKITLGEIEVPFAGIPVMKKGEKCSSSAITAVSAKGSSPVSFAGVPRADASSWIRTGHGRGFKGISTASGYSLRETLRKNFPNCGEKNFFLFIACDGYRTLFSGREIFMTEAGRSMMIIDTLDGKKSPSGPMLGPVADYYVDRDVWGLSHIVMLDGVE